MDNKLDLLDKTKSPNRIVWALAWPTIVEQLLMTVVIYVDAAMVGSVGVNATAAVAVNTTVIWLLQGADVRSGCRCVGACGQEDRREKND